MALVDIIRNNLHQRVLAVRVTLDSRLIPPQTVLGGECDYGWDQQVATATLRLSGIPAWFDHEQAVEIRLGWNGFTEAVFAGTVRGDTLAMVDGICTFMAQGYMARTESAPSVEGGIAWGPSTGKQIVEDCLRNSGVPQFSVDAGWASFATEEDVVLADGVPYSSLIGELDQIERCYTVDCPGGAVRRISVSGIPSASAAFSFAEGVNIVGEPKRSRVSKGLRNRVVVKGDPYNEISAARQADSPYVPDPPKYLTLPVSSAKIDTQEMAEQLAVLLMEEHNRKVDTVAFQSLGNPYAMPGMTVGLTSARMRLPVETNYFVKHVRQAWNSDGWLTDWTIEGGVGDSGYSTGRPPVADFTFLVEGETDTTGTYFLVKCTAAVRDPDTPPDQLTFAWTNDLNADTGSGPVYQTTFTEAQGPITITLAVVDPEANDDLCPKLIDPTVETIIYREWNHAFWGRAESTKSGGQAWNAWVPSSGHVISTPPLAPEGVALFGLDDGRLVKSLDHLMTPPTDLHVFPAAVNAVWTNEADAGHITIGLENGDVWYSADDGESWQKLRTFPAPVVWVEESYNLFGEIRVCSGESEYISSDYLGSVRVGATFPGGLACRVTLSPFGNYASGTAAPGVSAELGAGLTLPVTDVRALTHDALTDSLYAIARDGRAFHAQDEGAVTERTAIPGATGVNFALRDGDITGLLYACDEGAGLVKSFDAMQTWRTLRVGGAGLASRMLGYGAAALTQIAKTGRRVLLAGDNGKVFFTENVWSESVVWVDASLGLPAVGSIAKIRLDPFDNDRAYLLVNGEIYTNPDVFGGGTWVPLLTAAQATAAITPAKVGWSMFIYDYAVSAAANGDGRIYAYTWEAGGDAGVYRRGSILHTHDRGQTWTGVPYREGLSGYNAGPWYATSMVAGQHNADRVYWVQGGANGDPLIFYSANGGHSAVFGTQEYGATYGFSIAMPYEGNPNDLRARMYRSTANPANLVETADGGATWTVWAQAQGHPVSRAVYDPLDSSHILGLGGNYLVESRDGGATWPGVELPYPTGNYNSILADIFPGAPPRYYVVRSGATGRYLAVCTPTEAPYSWGVRDLAALTFTPTSITVDPRY